MSGKTYYATGWVLSRRMLVFSGHASGKLTLEYVGRMVAADILKHHPEIQAVLDEIEKNGWRYLYIETKGKAVSEIGLERRPYRVGARRPVFPEEGSFYAEVELGQKPPEVAGIPEVEEFRINVSSRNFPRAATVDLSKGVVTYVHDAFWKWEKGWESDAKKLSEAKEVHEVAKWLLDIKKYKLVENYPIERYNEVSKLL